MFFSILLEKKNEKYNIVSQTMTKYNHFAQRMFVITNDLLNIQKEKGAENGGCRELRLTTYSMDL